MIDARLSADATDLIDIASQKSIFVNTHAYLKEKWPYYVVHTNDKKYVLVYRS